MKQMRFLGLLSALCLLGVTLARADIKMTLGEGSAVFGEVAGVTLSISTTDPDEEADVQGLVAAFDWDCAGCEGQDLVVADALLEADTVVGRVEPGYMVLGVVMDSDPNDPGSPEIIPASNEPVLLATAEIVCQGGPDESMTPVEFKDQTYNTVDTGPLLDNIVVVGGLSIGSQEGLQLQNGSLECKAQPQELKIVASVEEENCGEAKVLMTNFFDVEGFVLAICHDDPDEIELIDIVVGPAAAQADFMASEIDPLLGGTFGVVIDLVDPMMDPPNITPGVDQHIATFFYNFLTFPPPGQKVCFPLRFCDDEIGTPVKENLIVQGGMSITVDEDLDLIDGLVCCWGRELKEICDDGMDNDRDGFVDCEDPDCATSPACLGLTFFCGKRELVDDQLGQPFVDRELLGPQNVPVPICFFLVAPDVPGLPYQVDHVQGFSMAVSYCCDIAAIPFLDISGTILEALDAEFVSVQADNNCNDGDGAELIIGVLVNALPPFNGRSIPPMSIPQRMGCVTFQVDKEADCDKDCDDPCLIEFKDGLNGIGLVPIQNLVSVDNKPFGPRKIPCQLCVLEEPVFVRGDCNFSYPGGINVEIADAAAVVDHLFGRRRGDLPDWPWCLDACDCNDDGMVDLADAICILQFLFQGGRPPPNPGPGFDPATGAPTPPGPDPTEDMLDCNRGSDCNPVPDP